jgi:hypothetical protein
VKISIISRKPQGYQSEMTPFECYIMYLAIRRHFSSTYDYFKYNGKVTAKLSSFEMRNDRYMFNKLTKISNVEDHLVANLSENPNLWIGSLLEENAFRKGKYFTKVKQSLTYEFKRSIINFDTTIEELMVSKSRDEYPLLLSHYINGKIDISVLVIFNLCLKFIPVWDRKVSDPIMWPEIKNRIIKITPFYRIQDIDKYKVIIQDHFLFDDNIDANTNHTPLYA